MQSLQDLGFGWYNRVFRRRDGRHSRKAVEESPGSKKQGVGRKSEMLPQGSSQLEPQRLCRFFHPKGEKKRVKRGNPPRCNLRIFRPLNGIKRLLINSGFRKAG